MGTCCVDLAKFVLFIVNFAALLTCGLVLGASIYTLFHSTELLGFKIEPNLSSDNPTAIYFSLILICIVIFGFLVLFTFLGCCGAACHNGCMLGSFIIILFVFLGAYGAGIAYVFLQFPDEVQLAANELEKTIPYYNPERRNSLIRIFWDYMQPRLRCCGAETWQDWGAAQLKSGRKVPASCCIVPDNSDCVYSASPEVTFQDSCISRLELPFRIVFWTLPTVMGIMLLAAMCVCSRQRNTEQRNNNKNRTGRRHGDQFEDTGYVYRASNIPDYPTAPPYNPNCPPYQNPYAANNPDLYPTGVIPPNVELRQPLIQPPPYHDVVPVRTGRV